MESLGCLGVLQAPLDRALRSLARGLHSHSFQGLFGRNMFAQHRPASEGWMNKMEMEIKEKESTQNGYETWTHEGMKHDMEQMSKKGFKRN